jgi:hypothetical protein
MQESAKHDQEQLPPRLALVSHALALAVTPAPQPDSSSLTTTMQQHTALEQLVAAAEIVGGCEWLWGYCNFLQRRHRQGPCPGRS